MTETNRITRRRFLETAALTGGGILVCQSLARTQTPVQPRTRREIRTVAGGDLENLREAYRELYSRSGNNSYQQIAGFHGVPDNYCHNDPEIFLPWHRAYILRLEEALRSANASVTLPYWDWTNAESIQSGITPQFAVETYMHQGQQRPNPLFAADIGPLNQPTHRNPRESERLSSIAQAVTACYNEVSYTDEGLEFDPDRQAAFLVVHELRASVESYNVDVFVDEPTADHTTPIKDNLHYAGSFGIFGGGKHAEHNAVKGSQRVLNLGRVFANLKVKGKPSLQIKLVVTDMEGKPVDVKQLPIKGFSVRTE